MSFILAEKSVGASVAGGCAAGDGMELCDAVGAAALAAGDALGDSSAEAADSPDLSLAPLLVAVLLATFALWCLLGAAQWLLSRLLPSSKRLHRLGHRYRAGWADGHGGDDEGEDEDVHDDSSAAPFDSPPTPPPTTWLRDADGAVGGAGAAAAASTGVGVGYFSAGRAGARGGLGGGGGGGFGVGMGAGRASPLANEPTALYTPSHYSTPGGAGAQEPLLFDVGGTGGSYGGGGGGTPYTGGGYTTGGGTAAGTGGARTYGVTPGTGGGGGGGLRLRSAAQRRDRRAAAEAAAAAAAAAAGGSGYVWGRPRAGLAGWFARIWRRGGGGGRRVPQSGQAPDLHDGVADHDDVLADPATSYGAAGAAMRFPVPAGGGSGGGGGGAGAGGGGGSGGWDPALLARSAALLPAISSVEGLMASREWQEHVRSSRGRSPGLERHQAAARLGLYRHLRRMDPEAFRRLLTRGDVRAYDSRPAPLALLLADYLISALAVPAALAALAAGVELPLGIAQLPAALRYGGLAVWLALRLWLAGRGHVSPLGAAAGAYLVYDDVGPEHHDLYGNGWACLAGLGAHLALSVVEVCLAVGSLGLLVPVSVLCLVLGGGSSGSSGSRRGRRQRSWSRQKLWRGRGGGGGNPSGLEVVQEEEEEQQQVEVQVRPRQTLAMRLLRVRVELEVTRPISLSPYSPSADPAGGSPPLSTPPPFGFGYGLGGGSDGGGFDDGFGFGSAQGSPRVPPGSVPAQTRYGRLAPPHWFR